MRASANRLPANAACFRHNAREYILSGRATAPLPEGYDALSADEQAEALEELTALRTGHITRNAQRYVENQVRRANDELQAEDPNAVEFFLYVKSAYSGGDVTSVEVADGVASFDFQLEFVASLELIKVVDGEVADQKFDLEVTDTGTGESEVISITMEASPSTDAFPKYDELFADGIYDISIVFGGDYNEERYDLETAKWTVEYLLEQGWENEGVSTFEELRHDSPPFTMALTVEGQPVEARVHIVHAQMDNDAGEEQQLLRDLVTEAIKTHDVIIYSGHAGANAGFILDYEPRYEISDDEFDELEMSDKYQIYVFDGCNSYRTYVDKLMLNPARSFENTTAITTVNTTPFSAGYEIINRFVHWLTLTDSNGAHFPVSWNTLLQGVNDQHPDVYYGVHGVDQDPKLNPHGGAELMCQSCESDADCGAGGNLCVNYEGGAACAVACTDSFACGEGYECIALEDDPELFYIPKQCVRTSLSCE